MHLNLSCVSALLAFTVMVSSCKKDTNTERFFSFEGKNYEVAYAVSSGYEGVRIATFSTSEDMRPDFGDLSYVSISFKLPALQPGNYTFKPSASSDFNPSENFYAATASLDFKFFYQQRVEEAGTQLMNVSGGTVIVTRDGSNYTFKYELDFNGRRVTGLYVGTIKVN